MKILKKSFVSSARRFEGALFVILVGGLVFQSEAQIYTLSQNGSTAQIDAGSQAGLFNWSVGGVGQVAQQWFWYRVGSAGPESSIDTISPVSETSSGANKATLTYANSTISVKTAYSLLAPGNGTATLSEQITVMNTSGVSQDYHFFQYSDFDLGGVPGNQSVQFYSNGATNSDGSPLYYEVIQTGANGSLVETANAPGASSMEVQAGYFPATLNQLNDGVLTTFNNTSLGAGPGDVTYAYEWDATLAPGTSLLISKLMSVPEPSSMALIASGMLALAWLRRRRVG